MKQIKIFVVLLSLLVPASGCVSYPGYSAGCNTSCGTGSCAVPFGCGSLLHHGVVDYVNGPPGGTQADCGACNSNSGCGVSACGGVGMGCGSRVGSCLGAIGDGVWVLGEGAFSLASAPFILAGQIVTGGGCGYEMYPNCGCSNEVYYGDNCYQQHDICDPCAGSCDPCGCGGVSVATSGCARCAGGHQEGIRYEDSKPNIQQPTQQPHPQKMSRPLQSPTPVRSARPVTQMSYRPQPRQQQAQRLIPPQPQRIVNPQSLPPQPQTLSENGQAASLPSGQ